MKILLIAATTGYQTRSFTVAGAEVDLHLTLATDRCHILEDPWGDDAIAVRFEHPHESAEILARRAAEFGGVVAVGDKTTLLAALAAEKMGLPWHPPGAALRCGDKHRMRRRFGAEGLLVPRNELLAAEETLPAESVGFPCVVKPLHLSASRGVIRANDEVELAAAIRRIRAMLSDPGEALQIETYIPGREFALEGLMNRGELIPLALFDKPDPLTGPFFEETIYVTPSREPEEVQAAILETTRRAVKALGLWHGPIHAEMRVNAAGVWMLEIAARPIGGLCARALRFRIPDRPAAVTLEQLILLHAAGRMPREIKSAAAASGVMMIPVPRRGIFTGVTGLEEALAIDGIDDIIVTAKVGEKLIPLPEGASYPGFIFASGPTPNFVAHALRQAHSHLRFEMLRDLPVVT